MTSIERHLKSSRPVYAHLRPVMWCIVIYCSSVSDPDSSVPVSSLSYSSCSSSSSTSEPSSGLSSGSFSAIHTRVPFNLTERSLDRLRL